MQEALSKLLDENIEKFNKIFTDSPDIKKQRLLMKDGTSMLLLFVEGLVDKEILSRDILSYVTSLNSSNIFDETLQVSNIPTVESKIIDDFNVLINDLLLGRALMMFNGYDKALSVNVVKFDKRNISEPIIEKNVRGPHEAFIEALSTNMSILRRRIKSPKLKFKTLTIGTLSHQNVAIAYIEGLAKQEHIDMVYEKLKSINYDGLFDVGFLEQLLTDNPYTPFPHFMATERPDKTMSGLEEGKIAILLDNSPSALIMPVSFFSFFQAPDDYNTPWLVGSLNRLVRIFAMLLAVFLPGLYIAVVSYHYYMIPLNLIIPLAESRSKVPFPPIIEALILELTIEMLREATIRLPTYIGTSIGIVGGLIIGQAAVQAGIVSNLIIIIVAVTAIASFLIPNYDMGLAIRYIRFIVLGFASIFGIIGIVISAMFIIAHLVVIESLGEPYFKPMLPYSANDFKDIILRPSLKTLRKRPSTANTKSSMRGKQNE